MLAPAVGLVLGQYYQALGATAGGGSPDDIVGGGGVMEAHQFTANHVGSEPRLELGEGKVRRECCHWG